MVDNKKYDEYDFVIVMEVKAREFETDCLICYELMKRGYKVKLISTWDEEFYRHHPLRSKVVVSWSMYNTATFEHIIGFVSNCNKMINLQCEQIYTNSASEELSDNVFAGVHGKAVEVVHLAWGNNTVRRLINKYNVDPTKVFLTGDIALDLYRPEFAPMIMSKAQLYDKYSIPFGKKLYLFISSFSVNELPDDAFEAYSSTDSNRRFRDISRKSQREILNWFDLVLPSFNDGVMVYRPHPAERDSKLLHEFEKKHENFRVISDEVIRQWIISADKIYTWVSTSIKEIYAAKRACEILRPCQFDYSEETQIYNYARLVTTYNEFEKNFLKTADFPIPDDYIKDFFFIPERPTYQLIADCFEKVLSDPRYEIDFGYRNPLRRELERYKHNIKMCLYRMALMVNQVISIVNIKALSKRIDYWSYCYAIKKKNHFSEKEFKEKVSQYRSILRKE